MWEAAEAPDDVTMASGMIEPRLTQPGIELHREILIEHVFGMSEWQAEKQPQLRLDPLHMSGVHRLPRVKACQRIGRVHVRRAAEGIAGELISQNQKRQRAFGRGDPTVMRSRRDLHVQVKKPFAEGAVESGVLVEPVALFASRPPVRDDARGPRIDVSIFLPAPHDHDEAPGVAGTSFRGALP